MLYSEAECLVLKYFINMKDPPMFSASFLASLAKLAKLKSKKRYEDDVVQDAWHRLFDEFGTHFSLEMTTGSKAIITSYMSEKSLSDYQSLTVKKKRSISFSLLGKAGGSFSSGE